MYTCLSLNKSQTTWKNAKIIFSTYSIYIYVSFVDSKMFKYIIMFCNLVIIQ